MKLKNDKSRAIKLAQDFKGATEGLNFRCVGISGAIKLWWWGMFKKHRAIFFIQRVVDGMWINIAWHYANEWTDEEIWKTLKALDWVEK